MRVKWCELRFDLNGIRTDLPFDIQCNSKDFETDHNTDLIMKGDLHKNPFVVVNKCVVLLDVVAN